MICVMVLKIWLKRLIFADFNIRKPMLFVPLRTSHLNLASVHLCRPVWRSYRLDDEKENHVFHHL